MVALDAIDFCLQQLVALLQRAHLEQAHSHSQAGLQKEKMETCASEVSYLLDVYSQAVIEDDHLLSLAGACAEESLVLSGCSVQIHCASSYPQTRAQTQRSHTHTAVQAHKTYLQGLLLEILIFISIIEINTKYEIFQKMNDWIQQ